MNESTLLSIKDFADFTGVNQSTLRYYDEIGLLPAAARGENNYRYYVPFQIIKLNYIHVLIDLGVPLSIIKDMDTDRTPESVIELLNCQEAKLDYRLYEIQNAYSIIHTYRTNIERGIVSQDGVIRIENLDETRFILGQVNDFNDNNTFYEAFVRFCQSARKRRINLRYPVGGYHDDINVFLNEPNRPNRYFSLDPLGNSTRPQGKYLVGYKRGYYGEFGDIPSKIEAYAKENGLFFRGPVYVIYLLDEITMREPGQFLSQIAVSVSTKKPNKLRKAKNQPDRY